MNERASHIWGYLRTSLACGGRNDLSTAVDQQDLKRLQQALSL